MIGLILGLLILFWVLGYIQIPGFTFPNITLLIINGYPVTLLDLLILFLIIWAIGILPSPFQEIGLLLLILWILATIGIIAIAGFSQLIVIGVIVGLIIYLLNGVRKI